MSFDYDVIIVGAGGAGLAAATSAVEAGAQVAVLEAGVRTGGSTALSGGVLLAAGTSVQRDAGVEDSPEALLHYYLSLNQYGVDPALARRFCFNGGATVEWFKSLGVEFNPDALFAGGADGVRRSHKPTTHGAGLIETLEGRLSGKCDISLRSRVEDLVIENGAVCGVIVGGEAVRARSVVLTSGGFGANAEMLASYFPTAAKHGDWCWYIGNEHSRGDGLSMSRKAGADIGGFDWGQLLPTPGLMKRLEVSLPPWLVMVNKGGRRFVDEGANAALTAVLIGRQPDSECFAIFDETARREAAPTGRVKKLIEQGRAQTSWVPDTLAEFTQKGAIASAPTLAALAERVGVNADALDTTIAAYNASVNAGADQHYFKAADALKPVTTAPFYAARIRPATICLTSAGPKIDVLGRVLSETGAPIRGLFAAGEVSSGTLGEIYAGGGNSVCNAMVGGRIAGRAAASER